MKLVLMQNTFFPGNWQSVFLLQVIDPGFVFLVRQEGANPSGVPRYLLSGLAPGISDGIV